MEGLCNPPIAGLALDRRALARSCVQRARQRVAGRGGRAGHQSPCHSVAARVDPRARRRCALRGRPLNGPSADGPAGRLTRVAGGCSAAGWPDCSPTPTCAEATARVQYFPSAHAFANRHRNTGDRGRADPPATYVRRSPGDPRPLSLPSSRRSDRRPTRGRRLSPQAPPRRDAGRTDPPADRRTAHRLARVGARAGLRDIPGTPGRATPCRWRLPERHCQRLRSSPGRQAR